MSKLNRSAIRYKEIEEFKDYELTPCIAYEMAIRSQLEAKIVKRGNIQLDKDGICIDKTTETVREGYKIRTHLHKYYEHSYVQGIDGETIHVPERYSSAGVEILENFKRPELAIDMLTSKNAKMTLNINRPLSELISLITHIKNDLEKNDGLKAPIELIGCVLEKADGLSRMCTQSKNGNTKCFDGRNGITRTQKLADMFFIYDMVKQGERELKIRTAISEYYESMGKTTETSDATFRKYRDIAIDFIDKGRYQELITGVKS